MSDRDLWQAVITNAVNDALYPANGANPNMRRARDEARSWFKGGGKDFREVCFLAGLDPEAVQEAMAERLGEEQAAPPKQPTKSSQIVTFKGNQITLGNLAKEHGMPITKLRRRLKSGFSIEDAVTMKGRNRSPVIDLIHQSDRG